MDRDFNYKGTSRLLLGFGVVLFTIAPEIGWLIFVGAGLCFVFAIICHTSHVGQQQAKESLENRKRLYAIEERLAKESLEIRNRLNAIEQRLNSGSSSSGPA